MAFYLITGIVKLFIIQKRLYRLCELKSNRLGANVLTSIATINRAVDNKFLFIATEHLSLLTG